MKTQFKKAVWIGRTGPGCDCPLFRREFTLTAPVRSVRLCVNALGYFEAYLNGRCIGDRVLEPGVSNYAKRSFVLEFDVAAEMKEGINCLGLWLGQGWYRKEGPPPRFPFPGVVHEGPLVRAELVVEPESGPPMILATDNEWRTSASHVSHTGSWGKGSFGGERVDARAERMGWAEPGYADSDWERATIVETPGHETTRVEGPPNRVISTWPVDSIVPEKDAHGDGWLIDAGRAFTGWLEIDFGAGYRGGDEITVEYSDTPPGEKFNQFRQQDVYICAGTGREVLCNRFNYHAFRWARVRGCRCPPEHAEARLISADMPQTGHFHCSNDLLNRMHDLQSWTLRCLTLGGVQVDCPHRERLGYGGDGAASLESTLYLFDADALYRNWLMLWRDEQRPDGGLPHTAPSPYKAGGGPVWCGFPITAAWRHYLHYGDVDVLRQEYPAAEKWFEFTNRHTDAEGLLQPWPNEQHRNWFLGDWLPPDGVDPTHEDSVRLIVNCFMVQCRDRAAAMAARLGDATAAARHADIAARLRKTIHRTCFDAARGIYADGDQVDLAYPLLVDAVPAEWRTRVLERLVAVIRGSDPPRLGTGLVGTGVLLDCLMREGRNDLLFDMVNHREYPGWGYMIDQGAGATWEDWRGDTDKRSHIHNCFNQLGSWFYKGLAGILPDEEHPGFLRLSIRPQPVPGLERMQASYRSIRGEIRVEWAWQDRVVPKFEASAPKNKKIQHTGLMNQTRGQRTEVGGQHLLTSDFRLPTSGLRAKPALELRVNIPDGAEAAVYVPCGEDGLVCRDGDPARPDATVRIGVYTYAVFHGMTGTASFLSTP